MDNATESVMGENLQEPAESQLSSTPSSPQSVKQFTWEIEAFDPEAALKALDRLVEEFDEEERHETLEHLIVGINEYRLINGQPSAFV